MWASLYVSVDNIWDDYVSVDNIWDDYVSDDNIWGDYVSDDDIWGENLGWLGYLDVRYKKIIFIIFLAFRFNGAIWIFYSVFGQVRLCSEAREGGRGLWTCQLDWGEEILL